MKHTVWDILVEANDTGDGHWEITLRPAVDCETPEWGEASMADTLDAYRWIAGITARIVLHLQPEVEKLREEHHCQWRCEVGGLDMDWGPNSDWGSGIVAYISVPDKHHQAMTKLVRDTLAQFLADDAATLTIEQELSWEPIPAEPLPPVKRRQPNRKDHNEK